MPPGHGSHVKESRVTCPALHGLQASLLTSDTVPGEHEVQLEPWIATTGERGRKHATYTSYR